MSTRKRGISVLLMLILLTISAGCRLTFKLGSLAEIELNIPNSLLSLEITKRGGGVVFSSTQGLSSSWQFPIHGETLLASNVKDHLERESEPAWDFWAMPGTLVYPAAPGVVTVASYGNEGGYGHWVKINHGNGFVTIYTHLGTLRVKVGDAVDRGTPLGEIAKTGMTSFPHTHFVVLKNNVHLDPTVIFGEPSKIGLKYLFWTQLPPEKNPWR